MAKLADGQSRNTLYSLSRKGNNEELTTGH
jgi:hypothetical protein